MWTNWRLLKKLVFLSCIRIGRKEKRLDFDNVNVGRRKVSNKKGMNNKKRREIILDSLTPPEFEKFPLVMLEIGGGGLLPYYNRGDNCVTFGLFGIYISFRRAWDPEKVWKQGVEDGWKSSLKTVNLMMEKIAIRESIIKKMGMLSGMKFVSEDPNDPFSPNGILYGPDEKDDGDDDNPFNFDPSLN